MRIGEKPQGCNGRFFDFFAEPHQSRRWREKSDVENRRGGNAEQTHGRLFKAGREGETLLPDIMHFPACFFGPAETIR